MGITLLIVHFIRDMSSSACSCILHSNHPIMWGSMMQKKKHACLVKLRKEDKLKGWS